MSSLLTVEGFSRLLDELRSSGFRPLGPVLRDGTITYAELASIVDLPKGQVDIQGPGMFRVDLHRARAPADGRPEGPSLASLSLPLSALPKTASRETKTSDIDGLGSPARRVGEGAA